MSALQNKIDAATDLFAAKLIRNDLTASSTLCSWIAQAHIADGQLRPLIVNEAIKALRTRGYEIEEGSIKKPSGRQIAFTLRAKPAN